MTTSLPNQPDHYEEHGQDKLPEKPGREEGEDSDEEEEEGKKDKADNFSLKSEEEKMVLDLQVKRAILRPPAHEPLTVPTNFKAKLEVDWKPNTGPAIDALNETITKMIPDVSWDRLYEDWRKAVVLPNDKVVADLRIIGTEDIPMWRGLRVGFGGLLLTEREEKQHVVHVMHIFIPQRTDTFKAEDTFNVTQEASTVHNKGEGQLTTTNSSKITLEAEGNFHAERWVLDRSVSLNCDGNIYFAACESTLSALGKMHLKVSQTLAQSTTTGEKIDQPPKEKKLDSIDCVACCSSDCAACCSFDCVACCNDCILKHCKCLACLTKLQCKKYTPPKLKCNAKACESCTCISCSFLCCNCSCKTCMACSCIAKKKESVVKDIKVPNNKYSRKVQTHKSKEEKLNKMYIESYLFDHAVDKNRSVTFTPPEGYPFPNPIEAKGYSNALSMQRHILHLGYRGLHNNKPAMGRIYLAAKQDFRMMQTVMSILASRLVPMHDKSELEEIDEQPKTLTAPKQIPMKAKKTGGIFGGGGRDGENGSDTEDEEEEDEDDEEGGDDDGGDDEED